LFEKYSRLLGKVGDKPLDAALQRCVLETGNRHRKRSIYRQLAISMLATQGHGHEAELGLPLRCCNRDKEKGRDKDEQALRVCQLPLH
jgi:hypothetical protein